MSHQDRALELLLTGKTTLEAAALVGVDPRTVRRWKKEPAFAEELSELRQEIHDEIMLRAMALVEKIQSAAFEQLEWLKLMANKAAALTDKLRCVNAITQLNFRWSKFIMDRQDKKTIAQFARTAQTSQAAKKADINGHGMGAKEQTAVSFAPCCEASPNQKADVNGHRSAEAPKPSATTKAPQQGGTGDTAPGTSLAPTPTQKADANGHLPALDPEVAALAAHRAMRAAAKAPAKPGSAGTFSYKKANAATSM